MRQSFFCSHVIHTRSSASVIAFGVKDASYQHTSWNNDLVWDGRSNVFQQDSAPFTNHDWLALYFYKHIAPNVWLRKLLELNPLDYYMWIVVERETNERFHNTIRYLKAAITRVIFNINANNVMCECQRSRYCLEAIIAAEGSYID